MTVIAPTLVAAPHMKSRLFSIVALLSDEPAIPSDTCRKVFGFTLYDPFER